MSTENSVANDNENVNVNQIFSFKLPPFWVSKPEIWFTQIEAQFTLNKISADKTKYNYVISSLPLDVVTNIYDIILKPPQTNLYQSIKDIIINRLTASEEKRLDELLSGSEIGDRKPSEFYRDMMNVVGGSQMVSQDLLIKLWKRRLPKTILIAITASGKENINDIVILADKIWESYQLSNINQNVNNISTLQSLSNQSILTHNFKSVDNSTNNQLLQAFNNFASNCQKTFQDLTQKQFSVENQISALQSQFESFKNTPNFTQNMCNSCKFRNRSRSKSPKRYTYNTSNDLLCYYHKKFQKKANKCQGTWCLLYDSLHQSPKNG